MKKSQMPKNLSPDALNMIAKRFRLLSEPIRLSILHALQAGEMSVGELTEAAQTSQPNVSKHLKMLQSSGLVSRRQEGNTAFYSIADQTIFELCDLVCGSLQTRLESEYKKMKSALN